MARQSNAAAAAAEAERAEREFNTDVNEAVARTDQEVFSEAMGDEPLGDDTDTSLEEMGEGLEGEDLDEEAEEQEAEGESEAEADAPEEGEAEAAEEGEAEADTGPPSRDERGRFEQRGIPPRVLREQAHARRQAESEVEALRAQLRDQQMRIDNMLMQQRQPSQQAPQAKPKPDMFSDPAAYEQWVLEQAEARASARLDERLTQFEQRQQMEQQQRLNENLVAHGSGPRGYEFNVAYRDLTSLPVTPQNTALVRRLTSSPDPGAAILDWWERDSNPEYVEHIRNEIREAYGAPQRGNRAPNRQAAGRQQMQPRHEVRLPRSLSSASGGRSQHVDDPEMWDQSEASVFSYGARR